MNLVELKPDQKHITKGRESLENILQMMIKTSPEVQAVYKRGKLKNFFYKDKEYVARWDFFQKKEEHSSYKVTNPWVYRIIKAELIENKSNIIHNPQAKNHHGYRQNKSLVKNLQVGDLIYQTDMSHCYLQIAKRLAYIGNEAYGKLIKKYDKAKTDICIAFTTAFSEEMIVSYKNGVVVDKKDTTHYELEHTLENICWEVYCHVDFLFKKYQEIVLGFVVDAIYSLQLDPIREYFDLMGIDVKTTVFEYWGDNVLFSPDAGIKKLF